MQFVMDANAARSLTAYPLLNIDPETADGSVSVDQFRRSGQSNISQMLPAGWSVTATTLRWFEFEYGGTHWSIVLHCLLSRWVAPHFYIR